MLWPVLVAFDLCRGCEGCGLRMRVKMRGKIRVAVEGWDAEGG